MMPNKDGVLFENDNYVVLVFEDQKTGMLKYAVKNRLTMVIEAKDKVLPMALSLAINWDAAIKKINELKDSPEKIEVIPYGNMRPN
jgi:hypothetical protein